MRNIAQRILSRNTCLHNEVEFLLREDLREPRDYYVILRAIAQGNQTGGRVSEAKHCRCNVAVYWDKDGAP